MALLCSGCSWFSWLPWVDKKKDPDAPAELTNYKSEVKIDRLWSASIGKGLGKQFMRMVPGVLSDRVYAADGYGYVEARERFKGKKLWSAQIGNDGKGMFSVAQYHGQERYEFRHRRRRRRRRARHARYDARRSDRVVGGGRIAALAGRRIERSAVGAGHGRRSRISADVGRAPRRARREGRRATLDVRYSGAGADVARNRIAGVSSGVVLAGFANGKVGAFRAASGEPLWEQRVMLPQGRSELDRIVDVDGSPVITANAVYAASFQGRLSAIRPSDGTVLWERDASSYVDLAQGYGNVYVVDDNSVITAIDQRTVERGVGAARAVPARPFGRGRGRVLSRGRRRRRISARADAR